MIDLLYECTKDNIELQGTYFNSLKKDICILFIHGQAQSILNNKFAYKLGKYLNKKGISFFTDIIEDIIILTVFTKKMVV